MASSKGGPPARIRHKALYGGPFGRSGRYAMASVPSVDKGLHSVQYLVVEPGAGAVLSVSGDKLAALAEARRLLRAADELAQGAPAAPAFGTQGDLWAGDELPATTPVNPKQKPVSRRRREVFERTGGRCHYCGTVLSLNGKWHVEHMLPRALGGGESSINLVASCVRCNLTKGDSTAIEFIARTATRD